MRFGFTTWIAPLLAAALLLSSTACKKKNADTDAAKGELSDVTELRLRLEKVIRPIQKVEDLDPHRVSLGERLYHDPNLSSDGTISCASCHEVAAGGVDGEPTSPGVGGVRGGVNSPTTLNSHLNFVQFWDGRADSLEAQARGPIENPVEMANTFENVVQYLQSEESYVEDFKKAFESGEINDENVVAAIADYERTLTTPNSPFDQWLQGDDDALNDKEFAGLQDFVNVGCTSCHTGEGLGGTMYQNMGNIHDYFSTLERKLDDTDYGRFNVTHNERDKHRFKVPILRNIALTGPYMHDGSVDNLADATRIMGYYQLGKELDDQTVENIVAFLHTLTGEQPSVDLESLNLPEPRTNAQQDDADGDEG